MFCLGEMKQGRQELLFLKKKKQKTFALAGVGTSVATAPRTKSFFGYFFFKKSNVLLPS
jgi:hypothetical protein